MESWDACDQWTQALMISYNQGRDVEEAEERMPPIIL